MVEEHKHWIRGFLLRVGGMALLGACWLAVGWLFQRARLHPGSEPSFAELAAATAAFLCFSSSTGLVLLGEGIFAQIEISERWARRPYNRVGTPAPWKGGPEAGS